MIHGNPVNKNLFEP